VPGGFRRPGGLHESPEPFFELLDPRARRARDGELVRRVRRIERRQDGVGGEQIPLGQHHEVGLGVERLAVEPDLVPQPVVRRLEIRRVERHEEGEHAGTLDVLEEAETESLARVGALDDAGDVRHDERPSLGEAHHAEVGLERGERVVRDLGAGRGQDRYQR
jgi:hypothetical protein